MKILLLLSISFILLLSCGESKELTTNVPTTPTAIITKDWSLYRNSVPVNIQNVLVIGNKMTINISYNGGCTDHYFNLVGNQFVTNAETPERFCRLYHDANGDDCRELVYKVLEYDISNFAMPNNEPVNLKLEGYPKPITYIKK
jgi:hypothetical protein